MALPPRKPRAPTPYVAPRRQKPPSAPIGATPLAEKAKLLATNYLRARWRVEPRILGAHPSMVAPGRWVVTAVDPRQSAAETTVSVDPLTGAVGLL